MARTKASVGAKVAAGKSSKARCSVAPSASSIPSGSGDKSKGHSGGNPVCPRETPKWQRPITNFFISKDDRSRQSDGEDNDNEPGSSRIKPKRNIIESDDEDVLTEQTKNTSLDESIELQPLDGENSHRIEEYYPTGKGKGVGKKTKGKENRRDSKRDRDEIDIESVNKKVKVDEAS